MKLPVLTEFEFTSDDPKILKKELRKARAGKIPLYMDLSDLKKAQVESVLIIVEGVMKELGANTLFPYPLYIITTKIKDHPLFQIVEIINDIPQYFKQKGKRLKAKETTLLAKTSVLADRIGYMPLEEILDQIASYGERAKMLKTSTKESCFYESILSGMDDDRKNEPERV